MPVPHTGTERWLAPEAVKRANADGHAHHVLQLWSVFQFFHYLFNLERKDIFSH